MPWPLGAWASSGSLSSWGDDVCYRSRNFSFRRGGDPRFLAASRPFLFLSASAVPFPHFSFPESLLSNFIISHNYVIK